MTQIDCSMSLAAIVVIVSWLFLLRSMRLFLRGVSHD